MCARCSYREVLAVTVMPQSGADLFGVATGRFTPGSVTMSLIMKRTPMIARVHGGTREVRVSWSACDDVALGFSCNRQSEGSPTRSEILAQRLSGDVFQLHSLNPLCVQPSLPWGGLYCIREGSRYRCHVLH